MVKAHTPSLCLSEWKRLLSYQQSTKQWYNAQQTAGHFEFGCLSQKLHKVHWAFTTFWCHENQVPVWLQLLLQNKSGYQLVHYGSSFIVIDNKLGAHWWNLLLQVISITHMTHKRQSGLICQHSIKKMFCLFVWWHLLLLSWFECLWIPALVFLLVTLKVRQFHQYSINSEEM